MQLFLQRKFGCRLYFLGFISCKQAASPVFGPGTGRYPSHDPWNRPFSKDYCKSRWVLGGQLIAGGFTSVLEGIQGDQDFIRILFSPSRPWNQYWCLFIPVFFFDPFRVTPRKIKYLFKSFCMASWLQVCKASFRSNSAVTTAEHVNGSMSMTTQGFLSSCTPVLDRRHPIGTRAVAVSNCFCWGTPPKHPTHF